MPRTHLVIPCYNEAYRLPVSTIQAFLKLNPDIFVLFVNDGSTDGTLKVIEAAREKNPAQIGVLNLERNRGKAEAVRRGMAATMESGAEFGGYWDADLATPLSVVPLFAGLLAGNERLEIVMGSRVQLLGHQVRRSLLRHYLGRIFATTVSVMLGLRVYDTQCGAKLFRLTPTVRGIFREEFSSRWIFDVELIARYVKACRVEGRDPLAGMFEQPLPEWRDVGGSKVRGKDFVAAFFDLIRICQRYRPRA